MKIRESVGQSIWNERQGWCCEPLDRIPEGHLALAIVPDTLEIVDWDIEEMGEKAGIEIEYRYIGFNDPQDPDRACVTQFAGIYADRTTLNQALETLTSVGIPARLFKIATSNEEIELKSIANVAIA